MNIAFKEWTLICDALGRGEQSLILRKGGIAEGRAGFRFQHPEFLLFPTLFHEQAGKLKVPSGTTLPAPRTDGCHEFRLRAKVEWTREVSDMDTLRRLAPFHLWTDEVIAERFHYDEKRMVHAAFVRVFALETPHVFPDAPRYGGCRSWVEVPPCASHFHPVLDDAAHQTREREILAILGPETPAS